MNRFAGKHAVITGALGGMGRAVAAQLRREGALLTLLDLHAPTDVGSSDALRSAATQHCQVDVTDDAAVAQAMTDAVARHGPVHHLVNAAGVLWFDRDCSVLEVDLDIWQRVIDINLRSVAVMARHCVPQMPDGASMVHVSSTQCYRGDDRPQDAYQAAKAGVIALSKSLAIQLAPRRIRSNVLVPGPTHTPMQARWDEDPQALGRLASAIPLGRVGTADDMAEAMTFLLSDQAAFITGTELIVDGGLLARP
jgi:NAD(P)-dependent dehydrogenase (short-subunit alcohol dehydrogenase family)